MATKKKIIKVSDTKKTTKKKNNSIDLENIKDFVEDNSETIEDVVGTFLDDGRRKSKTKSSLWTKMGTLLKRYFSRRRSSSK